MAENTRLNVAKKNRNDEFYTRYEDIEEEISAYFQYDSNVFRGKTVLLPCDDPEWSNFTRYFAMNFSRFGLKKLISTSYAPASDTATSSKIEEASPYYSLAKHAKHGKLYTLTRDANGDGRTNEEDIEFSGYLDGDGDFRSEEVTRLRDEADIIVTNPPFSLLREFVTWIQEGNKQFSIMGNKNAITYKEVFPLIKENKLWIGYTPLNGGRFMILPRGISVKSGAAKIDEKGRTILNVPGVCWFTNIDHGKHHEAMNLLSMKDNLKFNAQLRKKLEKDSGKAEYRKYDNYDAIEVPIVDAIPSDYPGVMGVPITFMAKYSPEQFEIVGATESEGKGFSNGLWKPESGVAQAMVDGKQKYKRIFIKLRHPQESR